MKKFGFLFVAAAVLVFAAGCAKENDTNNNVEENLVTYTFTAFAEAEETENEGSDEPEVRSTLTNAGGFSWAKDDQIAIWNSAASKYVTFTVQSVDGSGNATITGNAAEGAVWTNAIYPAARAAGSGSAVDYTVNTVAGPILVSQVDGQNLSFKYLGAVMNIQVTSVPDTPTKLTVTANANVFGSRSFTWNNGAPVLGGSGSQDSVTVPFNTSGITSVPVPQVSYAGFSITVDNAAGRHLYKKTTTNTFDLSSKKLLVMPTLAYAAPTKYYVTTKSTSGYWDRENVRMIQTGANAYSVQMNCDGGSDIYIFDNYNIGNHTLGYLNKGHVDGGNFYEITWNTSSSSGGPNYLSATRDYPFWNDPYPVGTNEMCLSGSFNNWGIANPFTYNSNMSWVLEGLTLSAGTYEFKIRKTQNEWAYAAGIYTGLGSSLYGTLKGDNGNATITVTAGTYNVYLNATSDWYYNIMFEKQ